VLEGEVPLVLWVGVGVLQVTMELLILVVALAVRLLVAKVLLAVLV
jgi:hypothetical protein